MECYIGVLPCLPGLISRVGILAATVALILCAVSLNSMVLDVNVEGLDRITRSEMLGYLREQGVSRFASKRAIDTELVRSAVLSYDGVAECTVELNGTTLTLKVIESTKSAQQFAPKPLITSRYDSRVTRIVARRGTSTVKTGDVVRIGQTLIEGVAYDQQGEVLASVPADGEVYGVAAFERTFVLSAHACEYRPTGRKKTRSTVSIFGKTIGKTGSPFVTDVSATETATLSAFIPITFTRTVYRETALTRVEQSDEQLISELTASLTAELAVTSDNVKTSAKLKPLSDGLKQITVFIEAEILISD